MGMKLKPDNEWVYLPGKYIVLARFYHGKTTQTSIKLFMAETEKDALGIRNNLILAEQLLNGDITLGNQEHILWYTQADYSNPDLAAVLANVDVFFIDLTGHLLHCEVLSD